MSANVIALNRCSVMEILWNKNEDWRLSSLMAARRRPSSWRNSTPLTLMDPSVSNAGRTNVYVCWRSTYLSSFLLAAFSAAPPAFVDVRWRYESATVSVTVTSHVRLLVMILSSLLLFIIIIIRPIIFFASASTKPAGLKWLNIGEIIMTVAGC